MRRNWSKTQGHDNPTPIASQRSPEWLGLRKKYVVPKTIVTKAYTTTMEISDWRTPRILLAGAVYLPPTTRRRVVYLPESGDR